MRPPLRAILAVVAEECHVPVQKMLSSDRHRQYVRARHVYSHAAFFFGHSKNSMARSLMKHRSTVQYGLRQPADTLAPHLERVMNRLTRRAAA